MKLPANLAAFLIEQDVLALRRDQHEAESQAIGAIFRDEIERVGRVAKRFRHLAALRIADDAGVVHRTKRLFAHVLVAGHDHARDPEENDVGTRHKIGGWVELLQCLRLLRPAHRRKRP